MLDNTSSLSSAGPPFPESKLKKMKLKKQKNAKNGFEHMPDGARATKGFGATLKRQSPKQRDKSVKKLRSRTRSLTSIKSAKSNKASRTKF